MNICIPSSCEFWPFHLKLKERLLLKHEIQVPLRPRAFDVLSILVQNAGCVVSNDGLLEALWADKDIEPANIAVYVCHIRKALDPSDRNRFITNLPRRGYQFVATVKQISEGPADSSANGGMSLWLAGDKGSGAVVPAPEKIIHALVKLYLTNGYNSCGLELCRCGLSLSETEQERMLAEISARGAGGASDPVSASRSKDPQTWDRSRRLWRGCGSSSGGVLRRNNHDYDSR